MRENQVSLNIAWSCVLFDGASHLPSDSSRFMYILPKSQTKHCLLAGEFVVVLQVSVGVV